MWKAVSIVCHLVQTKFVTFHSFNGRPFHADLGLLDTRRRRIHLAVYRDSEATREQYSVCFGGEDKINRSSTSNVTMRLRTPDSRSIIQQRGVVVEAIGTENIRSVAAPKIYRGWKRFNCQLVK